MPANYQVWLCTDRGRIVQPIEDKMAGLEYVKVVNGHGWMEFVYNGIIDPELLKVDRMIQVWRSAPGGGYKLDFLGFLRLWRYENRAGVETTTLAGGDQNELLTRRIIAYDSEDTKAKIAAVVADDAMKDIFNENFIGGATDSDRDWSGNDLSVAADESYGTAVTVTKSWRNVMDVLREINHMSRTDDDEVFFEIAVASIDPADQAPQLIFKTYANQPGANKTWPDGNGPVVFSQEWGNLENVNLEYDYSQEVNVVYAVGPGEGSSRNSTEIEDTSRSGASAWARREGYIPALQTEATAARTDQGNKMLDSMRPRVRFTGDLIDSEQHRYGRDWTLGDKVTAFAFGQQFDGIVRAVRVQVAEDGQETIVGRMEDDSL